LNYRAEGTALLRKARFLSLLAAANLPPIGKTVADPDREVALAYHFSLACSRRDQLEPLSTRPLYPTGSTILCRTVAIWRYCATEASVHTWRSARRLGHGRETAILTNRIHPSSWEPRGLQREASARRSSNRTRPAAAAPASLPGKLDLIATCWGICAGIPVGVRIPSISAHRVLCHLDSICFFFASPV